MTVSTKVLRTFVFAFLGIFLPSLANIVLDISNTADWSAARAALVSLIFAAFAAAIRAVVAYLPVLPDDDVGIKRTP
jgi:hypothetical protein